MAWLIYGPSIDPRLDPQFGWVGAAEGVVRELNAGRESLETIPALTLQKASHSRRRSPMPGFFRPWGVWVVCDAFKTMVDELEPDQNQFFPVSLLDKAGDELPLRYHLMNVTQKDDVLILEKSDAHWSTLEVRTSSGNVNKVRQWHLDPHPEHLFAKKDLVGTKHLWRGKSYFRTRLFFSDELMNRVKKAKLRGLVAYKIVEE